MKRGREIPFFNPLLSYWGSVNSDWRGYLLPHMLWP